MQHSYSGFTTTADSIYKPRSGTRIVLPCLYQTTYEINVRAFHKADLHRKKCYETQKRVLALWVCLYYTCLQSEFTVDTFLSYRVGLGASLYDEEGRLKIRKLFVGGRQAYLFLWPCEESCWYLKYKSWCSPQCKYRLLGSKEWSCKAKEDFKFCWSSQQSQAPCLVIFILAPTA